MFAIIETGGKQYLVKPGERVRVEKLSFPNKDIVFNTVLMVGDENETQIGTPTLKGIVVHGKVVGDGRGKKLIAYKYRRRKRTRVKKGHRQPYTEVEIISIGAPKKESVTKKEVEVSKVVKTAAPKTAKAPAKKKEVSKKVTSAKKTSKTK